MLRFFKLSLALLAGTILFLCRCNAMNSGSSGSVNSPFQPYQPIQPAARDTFSQILDKLREQYAGNLDLARIDPAHYVTASPHWFKFLAKANGKHVVVRGADRRHYAMDRSPLGDAAIILRTNRPIPGNNLYRIWRVKNVGEEGKREFVHLAFLRNERDFKWKNFESDRLFSFNELTGSIAHF